MSYFLAKKLKFYSKRIALAILFAVLFIPNVIAAQISEPDFYVKKVLSQAPQCQVTKSMIQVVSPATNRTKVGWGESFDFQYVITFKSDQATKAIVDQCRVSKPQYTFNLYMSDGPRSSTFPGGLRIQGRFYDVKDSAGNITESGYAFRQALSIRELAPQKPQPQPGDCQTLPCDSEGLQSAYIWVYLEDNSTYLPNYGFVKYGGEAYQQAPTPLEPLPGGLDPNTTPPTSGTPQTVDYTQVPVTIKPNTAGKGLRSKYRVIWGQQEMHFGVTGGLDGVHTEWGESTKTINPGDSFKLPDKDDGWGYTTDPIYGGMSVYFNFADDYNKLAANQKVGCAPGWISTDCTGVVFRQSDSSAYGAGALGQKGPSDFDPILKPAAWQKIPQPSAEIQANGNGGKPLGTVQFVALPAFIGGTLNLGGPIPASSVVVIAAGSGSVQPFNIEVFANENDIKTACKEEMKAAGKTEDEQKQCDNLAFAQYAFAEPITQTTSSTEKSDQGAVGDLFSFLRQVIAYIVLVLTGIIYYIFSAILVPVIVAILGIHPYKDAFVNFIYPGWVILRNVSNIFFIVALLWIGLRTIFQMEDAAKSRTFILRLILAALLVNFSLVIGQAIVGIADTVQSQFLPANSKVVETLGFKLMVEPIITFRGTEGGGQDNYGLTEAGNFTTQGLASDLPKAVILLVLAISAFFAFVALIAFLIVRIVALWLLYMVSPIAYVGRILPQTQNASNKWWSEFIKYAFAVPIMAFFLNIAALLAVAMAKPTGQSVQTGNSNTTILWGIINTGTIASEFVSFATTVLSHFLILVFMYGGMMFAMKFGGAGSQKIVEYAKKGFDAVTRKAPQALYQYGGDKTAGALEKRGYDKLAKGVSAVTHPKIFGNAVSQKFSDAKQQREDAAKRRLGDIRGLTRSNVSSKALNNAEAVRKDFDSEATGYLSAKMQEGDTDKNRFMTQAGMLGLAKGKNIDDIVKTAEKITGKKYGRNAAGLNAAVSAVAKKQNWTKAEEQQMMKTLDHAASLDTKTAHYVGNAEYNANKKSWTIKQLDPEADPNHETGGQQLNVDDHKKWTNDLVKKRLKKSPTEDLKTFSLDSMVTRDSSGNADGWTMAQIGVMGGRHIAQLQNREIAKKFKEADNYATLRQGYERMAAAHGGDGRQALIMQMTRYNDYFNDDSAEHPKWNPEEINQRANLIHSNFMSDSRFTTGGGSNGSGGNSGSGGGGDASSSASNTRTSRVVVENAPNTGSGSTQNTQAQQERPSERPVQFTSSKSNQSTDSGKVNNNPSQPTSQATKKPKSKFIKLNPIGSNDNSQTEPNIIVDVDNRIDDSAVVSERERLQAELDQMLAANDPALKNDIENIQEHIQNLDNTIKRNRSL